MLQNLPLNRVYLTGDFNIDLLKTSATDFEDIIYGQGFCPLISIATHFKPGCTPSSIDNILTNSSDSIIKSGVCHNVTGHHCPMFCTTSLEYNLCKCEYNVPKYDFSETNMNNFEIKFNEYNHNMGSFDGIPINEQNLKN